VIVRGLALAAALMLLGVVALALHVREGLRPARAQATPELFAVERGATLADVARQLERRGLIRDARLFIGLARWEGLGGALRAGEYDVSAGWSAQAILEQLTTGAPKTWEVVIPEGLRMGEIAARLDEAGLTERGAFLEVARDPAFARGLGIEAESLEGYLYPETYRMPRNLAPREVARVLVRQFERVWTQLAPLAEDVLLDRHQIVTLASIVEKETGAAEERPLIASVFWNRLRRGMRLETDPTVIYGIADFDGNLRRVHLEDESNPYNTYRIPGLPPGPIASPGRAALRAVLEPAETDYLYFVSRGDGSHVFSRSYAEHERAVDTFQRRRRP